MTRPDWLELFSSAAVGSLLALLAKEVLDHFRARRDQRLELQKRFFDAKFNATLQMVPLLLRTAVHVSEAAGAFANLSHQLDTNNIDAVSAARQQLRAILQTSFDTMSALFFVFDETLVADYDRACSAPLHAIAVSLTAFDTQLAEITRRFGDDKHPKPSDPREQREYRDALATVLREASNSVQMGANGYREGVEFMIARLRKEYRPYLL